MADSPVVFDISSDEENLEKGYDGPEGEVLSWLSKCLCDEVDDSDEVVVVSEIKSKSSKSTVNYDDDDDCVVLDGDPDKPVSADDDETHDGDGDDLVVVGQKGQIACRDYPHSRHLCAKFPFSSTAHETHCDMCHCYVCDSAAPCAHWGTGVSNVDHCHATEKEEFWKSQRKRFKLQKDAPLPVKVPDNSLPTAFSQLNETTSHDIIQLASNSVPQNQLSRPAIIRPCTSSKRLSIPNIISQVRSRHSGLGFSKNGVQTHLVSQQSPLLGVRNHVIRRDRGRNGSNLGMFRRSGIARGASPMNQSVYCSANNTRGVQASQCTNNSGPQATSDDGINMRWVPGMSQDSRTYQSFSQTGTGSVSVSTVPSLCHVYSQPISEPPVYSHPVTQPPVYNLPIPQQQVYSQPIPELQVGSQPIPQLQVGSQPIPLPHEYNELISQSNDGLNISEVGTQRQNTKDPDLSDFDSWVNASGNNQQPSVENCQLHRTGSTNELLPLQDFNPHCSTGGQFQFPDHEYDTWFPENYVQVPEGYVSAPFVDAGMLLFDFETSFDGLAHV